MVEPFSVVLKFAFEPFWEFSDVVDELSVQVLYASFSFAFVLRVGWMGEVRFDAVLFAPHFPVFLELWAVVGQYCLWKPLLLFEESSHFLCFSVHG